MLFVRKLAYATISLILFLSLTATVCALSVGVKSGDWIEYTVTYTGQPAQGHDVTWARMEIQSVESTNVSVSITSRFSDGSTKTVNYTLNLQTGHLIDDFIIPANLTVGDIFVDENLGNITITKAESQVYAGALRTVVSASSGNNTYVWDQATGVSVEGTSQTSEYSIHTEVSGTNMWQQAQGVGYTVLVLYVVFGLVVVVVIAAIIAHLRKKRTSK